VVASAGRVHGAAAKEQAAQHRLAVARLVRQGGGRRLRERSLEAARQGELDEERHPLLGLDRLVLRLHLSDRAAEADDLARDRVAQQREVGGATLPVAFQEASTRAEVEPEQLAQLAARAGRHQAGHLVLDVRRERNGTLPPDQFLILSLPNRTNAPPPSLYIVFDVSR